MPTKCTFARLQTRWPIFRRSLRDSCRYVYLAVCGGVQCLVCFWESRVPWSLYHCPSSSSGTGSGLVVDCGRLTMSPPCCVWTCVPSQLFQAPNPKLILFDEFNDKWKWPPPLINQLEQLWRTPTHDCAIALHWFVFCKRQYSSAIRTFCKSNKMHACLSTILSLGLCKLITQTQPLFLKSLISLSWLTNFSRKKQWERNTQVQQTGLCGQGKNPHGRGYCFCHFHKRKSKVQVQFFFPETLPNCNI